MSVEDLALEGTTGTGGEFKGPDRRAELPGMVFCGSGRVLEVAGAERCRRARWSPAVGGHLAAAVIVGVNGPARSSWSAKLVTL